MKKVIKSFVVWQAPPYEGAEPRIDLYTFDPRKTNGFSDSVVVQEKDIEIEVPDDFDPRPSLIANLKAEEKRARADFEMRITQIKRQIKRQISELQAIELSPGAA